MASTPKAKLALGAILLALATPPLAAVIGALAHVEREYGHAQGEEVVLGGLALGTLGLFAAIAAALARRWPTGTLAVALAAAPWMLVSVVPDLREVPPLSTWDSAHAFHATNARYALKLVNAGASSAAVLLGLIAVSLALALEPRRDPDLRPLSRGGLLAALAPVAILALIVAWSASMLGFTVIAVALAALATLRVAAHARSDDPKSLGLAVVSIAAASLSVAAACGGASAHGMWSVLHEAGVHLAEPDVLGALLARYRVLELGSIAPMLALLPLIGLAWATDARAGTIAIPRVAAAGAVGLALLALYLDSRNALDARTHASGALAESGATTLVAAPSGFRLALVDGGGDPIGNRGVIVWPRSGAPIYHGEPLDRGLGRLAVDRELPAIALGADATADEVLAIVQRANAAGVPVVRLVARSSDAASLVTHAVGPAGAPHAGPSYDRIVLYLQLLSDGRAVIASTAGERIEIEDRPMLTDRLRERRQAEPNRRDIVLAPEHGVPLERLLDALVRCSDAGFDLRFIAGGDSL